MPDQGQLLDQISTIASQWRAGHASATSANAQELSRLFQRHLSELYDSGWDYALGWENELPDDLLPERYLTRRAEILDALETELAYRAMDYRRSVPSSEEETRNVEAYRRIIEELFRIGHWSGAPDAESMLPNRLMPAVYKEYWRQRWA